MMYLIQIEWGESPNYIVLCILLGIIAAALLYYKERKTAVWSLSRILPLALLRLLVVTALALLLLLPLIKSFTSEINKRHIIWVQDVSQSISKNQTKSYLESLEAEINELDQDLSEHLALDVLAVGADTRKLDSFVFNDEQTDLSAGLEYVFDTYSEDQIAAIVVASDGIYNQGQNPAYLPTSKHIPLYTLALGDTTAGIDIDIKRVFANKVVYKNDRFEIEVDVAVQNLPNTKHSLQVYQVTKDKTTKLESGQVDVKRSDYFKTFIFQLDAKNGGVHHYRVGINPESIEENKRNNYQDFYVEVLDNRSKVLLLSHAPHPDLEALRYALSEANQYEMTIHTASDFSGSVKPFDLVILHGLPSKKHPLNNITKQVKENKTSVLYVGTNQTNWSAVNNESALVTVPKSKGQVTESQVNFRDDFSIFELDDDIKKAMRLSPPLQVPFGEITAGKNFEILANQRIKNVDTDYPLMVFGERNDGKRGLILGAGIWRWKLFNYAQNQNFDAFNELMSKVAGYLTVKTDKSRFRTYIDKTLFTQSEEVRLDAELYNASYELKNDADVQLVLKDQNGNESDYVFSKKGNGYALNLGTLRPGNYSYKVSTKTGKEVFSKNGRFTVRKEDVEIARLQADHNLLANLAYAHNGTSYKSHELSKLMARLKDQDLARAIYTSNKSTDPLINYWFLLPILLLGLALEWFLRRYWGAY